MEIKTVFDPSKREVYAKKRIDDPDIFYGRGFEGDETPICDILEEMGEVVVKGKVIRVETREIRNEKTIVIFDVSDFTDTITAKIFTKNEFLADVLEHVKRVRLSN